MPNSYDRLHVEKLHTEQYEVPKELHMKSDTKKYVVMLANLLGQDIALLRKFNNSIQNSIDHDLSMTLPAISYSFLKILTRELLAEGTHLTLSHEGGYE